MGPAPRTRTATSGMAVRVTTSPARRRSGPSTASGSRRVATGRSSSRQGTTPLWSSRGRATPSPFAAEPCLDCQRGSVQRRTDVTGIHQVAVSEKAVTHPRRRPTRGGQRRDRVARPRTARPSSMPETRDRILAVMDELGFTPSPAARRLSLGRTLTIGVVVSFLTRPQAAERLRGVDVVARRQRVRPRHLQRRVRSRSATTTWRPSPHRSAPTACSSCRCRRSRRRPQRCARRRVPVVFIDVHTPADRGDCRGSSATMSAGGALAARHLLDLGHRDDRLHRRRRRGPVRVHLEPGPRSWACADELAPGRDRAAAGRASGSGRTDGTRRASSRARMLAGDRPPDGDLRRQRHAGARRRRRGPRAAASTCPTTCRSSATTTSRPPTTSA